jgi:hypothetical protein
MRRRTPKVLLPAVMCCLAGCALVARGGMADRCADFMVAAYPGADIDITKRGAAATSLTTIVAEVEGVRTNLPPHAPPAARLAVECRFESSVLTSFRWTKGPN